MKSLAVQFRSFNGCARLLMVQQFTINTAFYMLMPYLAVHLAAGLGMAAWAVGLVLGVRNFTQQGMFLVGGTLADRLGYKPVIVVGCVLRTVGFGLLGFVSSLPALVVASAATGFAGALFNPAVRAYLAQEAGERRVEAFAAFNVFYQAGMFVGPLVGLVLLAADFRLICSVAAVLFLALTVIQLRMLPVRKETPSDESTGVLADWRTVIANRPFLLFALAMIGSYVLSFQVYLALPLQAHRAAPDRGDAVTTALFTVSAAVAVAGQLKITAWARARWSSQRAIVYGIALMGAAFLPLLIDAGPTTRGTGPLAWTAALSPLFAAVALLALGTAMVYPFEMDTVVSLAGGRLVATHYGLYNTVAGLGITLGNLTTGAVWDAADRLGHPELTWWVLAATGAFCAGSVGLLARSGRLTARPEPELAAAAS
ncbi:MDR family MFS transporter [Streptomyces chiangmaiensis]|uniref:MFS transporter n=1 Tax=Streptomyces chiangmaiensis TaxID=766497 RepID=A0ABU7FMY7_9ACTN|nr:MFS transporter [Streptomyces chiangmaiensis]MED7825434.1 MFS transporter [Streptomyces chiangmaiensis]